MANEEQLKALYKKVMGGNAELDLFTANEKFMLRVWDGMDGCWTDCFDADVDAGTPSRSGPKIPRTAPSGSRSTRSTTTGYSPAIRG
jgi:hypothetical protein